MKKNIATAAVMAVASAAILCGCTTTNTAKTVAGVEGSWGLDLSPIYPELNAGWLKIENGEKPSSSILWRWASPFDTEAPVIDGNKVDIRWRAEWPRQNDAAKQRWNVIKGVSKGDIIDFEYDVVDGNKKSVQKPVAFKAHRIAPVPAEKPDLSKIVYGKPVDMLEKGLDGWETMNPNGKFGWKMKEENGQKILSNELGKKPDGSWMGGGANIRSKRADFFDFSLSYDVRVPKDSNSGVYLRGIYECQVIDSYGKPVDCHNMAAYYGRVTPSVAAEKAPGEWQHVDVTLYRRHLTVVLNGVKIIDNTPVIGITGGAMTWDETKKGPLYLQGDHSDADFRNMILTPIVK